MDGFRGLSQMPVFSECLFEDIAAACICGSCHRTPIYTSIRLALPWDIGLRREVRHTLDFHITAHARLRVEDPERVGCPSEVIPHEVHRFPQDVLAVAKQFLRLVRKRE